MSEEREYNYIVGVFDIISKAIRKNIAKATEDGKPLGIGVYTEERCEKQLCTKPIKSLEHRMEIALGLSGVSFVFPVDETRTEEDIPKLAEEAYQDYMNRIKVLGEGKKYKVGFIIGSFDLLHQGHIENIRLASNVCENIYVILKSDERIFKKKGRYPIQNTSERAEVLRSLKQVRDVLYYDLDSTREDVIEDVISTYLDTHPGETLERHEMAAIFGEDLESKENSKKDEWGDVNIIITPRPEEKMKNVSSSASREKIGAGGIKARENIEADNIIASLEGTEDSREQEVPYTDRID